MNSLFQSRVVAGEAGKTPHLNWNWDYKGSIFSFRVSRGKSKTFFLSAVWGDDILRCWQLPNCKNTEEVLKWNLFIFLDFFQYFSLTSFGWAQLMISAVLRGFFLAVHYREQWLLSNAGKQTYTPSNASLAIMKGGDPLNLWELR